MPIKFGEQTGVIIESEFRITSGEKEVNITGFANEDISDYEMYINEGTGVIGARLKAFSKESNNNQEHFLTFYSKFPNETPIGQIENIYDTSATNFSMHLYPRATLDTSGNSLVNANQGSLSIVNEDANSLLLQTDFENKLFNLLRMCVNRF